MQAERSLTQPLLATVGGREKKTLCIQKAQTTLFPQMNLQNHLLIFFKPLQEREAITNTFILLPTTESKMFQHSTTKYRLREQQQAPAAAQTHRRSTAYLMMVMNCVMVSSSGTRNLVLSKRGRYFSLWYLSTITCFNQSHT